MSDLAPQQSTSIAASLRQEFHESYGTGRDFEGSALIEFMVGAGHFLSEIVGAEVAGRGMAEIARALDLECKADEDWEQVLRDNWGDAFCWPMGMVFHDLNAYAYYGFALNGGKTAEERAQQLAELIGRAEAFMRRVPLGSWCLDAGDAGQTLRLAQGRWALDNGQPIEPYALAAFGGISERRVRNMMAGRESAFPNIDGKVPAKVALEWLKRRENFRQSVWREQDAFDDLLQSSSHDLEDVCFVPIARDGSTFHPGLARDGGYSIGPAGQETVVTSYGEALAALQRASQPTWRRPSPHGSWVNVTAVRWERKTAAELDHLAASHAV